MRRQLDFSCFFEGVLSIIQKASLVINMIRSNKCLSCDQNNLTQSSKATNGAMRAVKFLSLQSIRLNVWVIIAWWSKHFLNEAMWDVLVTCSWVWIVWETCRRCRSGVRKIKCEATSSAQDWFFILNIDGFFYSSFKFPHHPFQNIHISVFTQVSLVLRMNRWFLQRLSTLKSLMDAFFAQAFLTESWMLTWTEDLVVCRALGINTNK